MSLVAKLDSVTVPTGRIRLHTSEDEGISGMSVAATGDGGAMGGVIFDDPDHTLTLQGWTPITIDETDCTDAPRLFTGYLGDRTTTRGKYPADGGRQIDTTLYDPNCLLNWLLIGADGKRPAESRADRIAWLLASDWWPPNVFDVGWIVPGVHQFDEADYRRQYAADVLSDILETYQTFFVKYDQVSERLGIFYDAANSTNVTSTLTISNDLDDILFDSYDDDLTAITCFPPLVDGQSVQAPDSVYSLVDLQYTGGDIREEDTGTTAQFFSTVGPRGVAVDESRIGKSVTAQHFVTAYLAQDATEDETVTCSLILPSYKVGLIDAGDRISSAKFVHLDGYESGRATRVRSKTLRTVEGRRDLYLMTLELNDRGPFGGKGGGGGTSNPPPTVFPPGTQPPAHFYAGSLVFHTDGYGTAHITGVGAVIPNRTDTSTNTAAPHLVLGTTYNYSFTINLTGGDNPPSVGILDDSGNAIGGGLPNITGTGSGSQTFTGSFTVTGADVLNGYAYFGAGALGHPVGGRATSCEWVVDPVGWDPGGAPQPLVPGQPNQRPEVVTMSGADGTTLWPFADGTLEVWVDNTDQSGAILTQDGPAGTFTLDFTPWVGEVVTVRYLGR